MSNNQPIQESNALEYFAIILSTLSAIAAVRGCGNSDRSSQAAVASAQTAQESLAISEENLRLAERRLMTETERFERRTAKDDLESRKEQTANVFLQLKQTENRYQLIRPESLTLSMSDGHFGSTNVLKLEILVRPSSGNLRAYFRLPRTKLSFYRQQTLSNGTKLPLEAVEQPTTNPINIENVSPFECIDCTNNVRLALFVEAKKIRPSSNELDPTELISLARAANDFGNIQIADRALEKAISALSQDFPNAFRSETLGEIGKTYLLMGNVGDGFAYLAKSRALWASDEHPFRTNPIYDSLLWEAQFACRSDDKQRATLRLKELSESVAVLDVSVSEKHRLVEGAFASCIAILAEFAEYDPEFDVPKTHILRDINGAWILVSEALQTATPQGELPPTMTWSI